jgi:hypothetical protein
MSSMSLKRLFNEERRLCPGCKGLRWSNNYPCHDCGRRVCYSCDERGFGERGDPVVRCRICHHKYRDNKIVYSKIEVFIFITWATNPHTIRNPIVAKKAFGVAIFIPFMNSVPITTRDTDYFDRVSTSVAYLPLARATMISNRHAVVEFPSTTATMINFCHRCFNFQKKKKKSKKGVFYFFGINLNFQASCTSMGCPSITIAILATIRALLLSHVELKNRNISRAMSASLFSQDANKMFFSDKGAAHGRPLNVSIN